jgi:hypothetical protein
MRRIPVKHLFRFKVKQRVVYFNDKTGAAEPGVIVGMPPALNEPYCVKLDGAAARQSIDESDLQEEPVVRVLGVLIGADGPQPQLGFTADAGRD